nr:SET and MYND domain-containing protein 4-like isoform X3 [Lepeophtheirus salmonis]
MSFLNKLEDFLGSKDAAKKYESKKNRLEHGDQIQILFESKTIQDLFKKEQFTKKKSTLDAKRFRDLGNEAYKSSQDIKALELYSRSCQTSTNDNELALALANRSAAALRLGKWTTALQNVELAIHINSYPPENLYKLHERRAKIYVHMGKKEEASSEYLRASKLVQDPTKASEFITLSEKSFDTFEKEIIVPENAKDKGLDAISFTPNTNFPGLSNAVNIVYEDTKGRFGVATRDIQVGEYIGVEEPVVSRIKKMYQGSHCNGCMQSLEDSCFLPCLHCEDANYCSLVCRSKSFESYHKYECGLSTFLEDALIKMKGKSSEIDDYYRLGFRSISQRPMEYFRKSYNELINASSQLEKDQIFDQKDYKSLSSLVDNYKDDEKDNLWVQISVCFIIRSLREKGYFVLV